uniref:PHD-type domain-containing protein n=1 Tax=Amphimedon queenslandica TaxID=400682 RepID=A0A1X7TD91_AMPQE
MPTKSRDKVVPASTEKTSTGSRLSGKKSKCICPICDDGIDDAIHDSIFCEGTCQAWVHRGCGGLSKSAHEKAKGLQTWCCPQCRLDAQSNEISALKKEVTDLTKQFSSLKLLIESRLSTIPEEVNTAALSATRSTPTNAAPSTESSANIHRKPDKKFNLVVTGLKESAPKTPRSDRVKHDFDMVSSLFSPLLPIFSENTVRDCLRLGKYSSDRSRPLLVTLNRSCDVSGILSNKSRLADKPSIGIRADLPPHLRQSRSKFLKQRRDLISSGVNPSVIKAGNLSLYVHGKKFGSVVNQEFQLCPDSDLEGTSSSLQVDDSRLANSSAIPPTLPNQDSS